MPDPQLIAYLHELAAAMCLEDELPIDESGACAFQFPDGPIVLAKGGEGDGLLWLCSLLGEPEAGPAVYPELLRANLAGCGHSGLIFSLPQEGVPGILAALPIAWQTETAHAAADIVARFLDALEDWSRTIAAAEGSDLRKV